MKSNTLKTFASCLAVLCLTAAASALVPCDKKSECSSAKAVAQVVSTEAKTCDGETKTCPVARAASAYLTQVNEIMAGTDSDMCPGGASVMALMSVLKEDENYRPMVAAFEQFMAEQMGQGEAAAQVNATSDSSGTCGSGKAVAQVNTSSDCAKTRDAARRVAQVNADGQCRATCTGAKTVTQINTTSECTKSDGAAKGVAQVNASGECRKTCTATERVSQITTTTECAKTCDGSKRVAQVTADSQCSKSAQKTRYVAFESTKCDRLARIAARNYLNLLVELKQVAGVEGCPMNAANKTLSAVMAELQAEMAAANADEQTDTEAVAVSMGAVSEQASGCCASKK